MADTIPESLLGAIAEVGGLSPENQQEMRKMGLDPKDKSDRDYFKNVQQAQHAVGADRPAEPTGFVNKAEEKELSTSEIGDHTPGGVHRFSKKEITYLEETLDQGRS